MAKQVSPEDRTLAQKMFAAGASAREISDKLGGRVSPSWVSANSRSEGWLRGVLPKELVASGEDQIYEPANASPEVKNDNTNKLEAAAKRRFVQRKAELANRMADGAEVLLGQIFSPHVVKDVKVLSMGREAGQQAQMIEYTLSQPSPADKKHLATTLGILLDKSLLLTGEATSRTESVQLNGDQTKERLQHIRDELAERAARKELEARTAEERKATG